MEAPQLSQRIPQLPLVTGPRPPMCAVLDSCVLWLRHNLRKKLEVNCYMQVLILPLALYLRRFSLIFSRFCSRACIRTCHQIVSFLQKHGIRLGTLWVQLYYSEPDSQLPPEYYWIEFWRAVLGLLEFLTKKIDELQSAAGIRLLIKEVRLLHNSLFHT